MQFVQEMFLSKICSYVARIFVLSRTNTIR